MKRLTLLLIMLLCVSACGKKEDAWTGNSFPYEQYLASLPDRPSEDDDIFIIANDGTHNTDVWDAFIETVDAGSDSQVTIARYTIEGEVIYELLRYEKGEFFLYTDSSRDSYGSKEYVQDEKMWLYEYSFIRDEDINGTVRPYIYLYCFLSDQEFNTEEEVQRAVDQWFAGKQSELVVVWADSARYEE